MVLNLKIETPKDGATVNTSTVMVSCRVTGTQSTSAKVKINGTDVPVKDGKYSTSIALTEGQNVINIAAESGGFTKNEKVTVTYVPAK